MRAKAPWTSMPQYATKAKVKKPRYIKARTPKRAKEEREYHRLLKVWMIGRKCDCCYSDKIECHHKFGRRGKLLCMTEYWIALCSKCHASVHDNPSWAITQGLLAPTGQFNSVPKSPLPTT